MAGKETGKLLADFHIQIGIEMKQGFTVWIEMRDRWSPNPLISNGKPRSEAGRAGGDSSSEALAISSYELIA